MSKKRTTLDSVFTKALAAPEPPPTRQMLVAARPTGSKRPGIKQHTAYLPEPVHEQLRRLAFEERAKIHDYLIEGLDLVFAKRGLPPISELVHDADRQTLP
jgi:hypothetical protein